MRRVCSMGIVLLVVAFVALYVIPTFIPWTPLNCLYEDVDICTGRSRVSWYLAFCKVSERVHETALSRVLPRELIEGVRPHWERVNTFSPGVRHSPHHRFHGASSQIRDLELLWQNANVDELTKRKMALHLLVLWQFDGSYILAGHYIQGLLGLTDQSQREPLLQSIRTLEIPEERVEGDHRVLTVYYPDGHPMERVQGYRDSSGRFVRHGIWETWHANGKRSCYGHLEQGEHHGPRFEWDQDGKLMCVETFNHGELVGYESEHLASRPDYEEALRRSDGD
jgi:hypothetical protein